MMPTALVYFHSCSASRKEGKKKTSEEKEPKKLAIPHSLADAAVMWPEKKNKCKKRKEKKLFWRKYVFLFLFAHGVYSDRKELRNPYFNEAKKSQFPSPFFFICTFGKNEKGRATYVVLDEISINVTVITHN